MSYAVRRALAVALAAAIIGVLVVLVALLAPRWDRDEGGSFTVRETRVRTLIDPQSALIGDAITATARVFVDTGKVDPGSVRLQQEFTPFGSTQIERTVIRGVGSAARIDFVFRLQCVTVSCLTKAEVVERGRTLIRPIRIEPGAITARSPSGAPVRSLPVSWSPVMVRSRLYTDQPDQLQPRDAAYRAPRVSYAISPSFLGWLSVGFALALALVGGTLVALAVRGTRLARRLRIPAHLTAVDRAIALARHARTEGDTAGERRALERLAAALRASGQPELGLRVQRLAWSKEMASDDAFAELARELTEVGSDG